MDDTKFMKNMFYLSQYTKKTFSRFVQLSMSASPSESASPSKMAGWAASRSSSVG